MLDLICRLRRICRPLRSCDEENPSSRRYGLRRFPCDFLKVNALTPALPPECESTLSVRACSEESWSHNRPRTCITVYLAPTLISG